MRKSVSGFTIVELLIVIVVIAILAVISVVAYNGIQNRAYDSSVQSDLKSLATKLELFKTDSAISGYPNPASSNDLNTIGFKATKNAYQTTGSTYNLSYCFLTSNSAGYIVIARSKSGAVYFISSRQLSPRVSTATWGSDVNTTCSAVEPDVTINSNLRGYAAEDTTTGPWRAWVGGN